MVALVAVSVAALAMWIMSLSVPAGPRTVKINRPFHLGTAWYEVDAPYVARHRAVPAPDRDWIMA